MQQMVVFNSMHYSYSNEVRHTAVKHIKQV